MQSRDAVERAAAGVDYSSCGRLPEESLEATVAFGASTDGGFATVYGEGLPMTLAGCIAGCFRQALPTVPCPYHRETRIVVAGNAIQPR